MCYSARVEAEFTKLRRETGTDMDIASYVRTYWCPASGNVRRPKVPRAAERDILAHGPREVTDLVRQWDAREVDQLTRELFVPVAPGDAAQAAGALHCVDPGGFSPGWVAGGAAALHAPHLTA